jgi:hypothetical protein
MKKNMKKKTQTYTYKVNKVTNTLGSDSPWCTGMKAQYHHLPSTIMIGHTFFPAFPH